MQGLVEDNPGFAVMVGAEPAAKVVAQDRRRGKNTRRRSGGTRKNWNFTTTMLTPIVRPRSMRRRGGSRRRGRCSTAIGRIPTIKAVLAERDGDDGWSCAPPLMLFAAEKLGELRERRRCAAGAYMGDKLNASSTIVIPAKKRGPIRPCAA